MVERGVTRPPCSVYIATSLDGFIARENGGIDWLSMVERPGEDYGFKKFFDSVDTMVMGRTTYDTVLRLDAWSYTGKRCVILTHTSGVSRHGEEFDSGDVAELVGRLGAEGSQRIYVDGGAVIAQFFAAKLIDEVTVSVIPILLGEGRALAPKIGHDVRLELTEHRAFESGLVQLTYRVMK